MSGTEFGGSWWGKRWVEALERLSTAWQNRLPRGRDYASKGHVISLAVSGGKISAKVQGSRSKPYTTTIEVPTLRDEDWDAVIEQISSQARFPAKLLVGEMPADIEDIFQSVNVTLFPMRNSELLGSCTCPDKARPCKHIAAVHYAFGQALDRDPFLLFQLRGADRMRLQRGFHKAWFGDEPEESELDHKASIAERGVLVAPLSADRFNRSPDTLDGMSFTPFKSVQSRLILERLSAPRSWEIPIGIEHLLGPVYDEATKLASEIATAGFDADLLDAASGEEGGDAGNLLQPVQPKAEEAPAETTAEEGGYKAFEVPVAAPEEPEDGEEPRARFALPSTLGAKPKPKAEPAPEPEAPKKSRPLLRKGVAAMSRRRKNRTGEVAVVSDAKAETRTDSAADESAKSAEEPRGPRAPRVVKRRSVAKPGGAKASAATEGPTVVRRRSAPSDSGASPVVRRRRTVVPARAQVKPGGAEDVTELAAADAAGLIALGKGEFAEAAEVTRRAWRAEPSQPRFTLLLSAAKGVGDPQTVLDEEAAYILENTQRRATSTPELLWLLAAGKYRDAADRARATGKRAWKGGESPGSTYVGFLPWALATSLEKKLADGSALERVWGPLAQRGEGLFATLPEPPDATGFWLKRAVEQAPVSEADTSKLLSAARDLVTALASVPRIDSSGQKADQAAAFIVATAEAMAIAETDRPEALRKECAKGLDAKRRLLGAIERAWSASPFLS